MLIGMSGCAWRDIVLRRDNLITESPPFKHIFRPHNYKERRAEAAFTRVGCTTEQTPQDIEGSRLAIVGHRRCNWRSCTSAAHSNSHRCTSCLTNSNKT